MAPTLVLCPGLCGPATCGQRVEAHGFGSFTATTVSVDPCDKLLAQGWVGPQLVERKSRADYLLDAQPGTWQHRDGLVSFPAPATPPLVVSTGTCPHCGKATVPGVLVDPGYCSKR